MTALRGPWKTKSALRNEVPFDRGKSVQPVHPPEPIRGTDRPEDRQCPSKDQIASHERLVAGQRFLLDRSALEPVQLTPLVTEADGGGRVRQVAEGGVLAPLAVVTPGLDKLAFLRPVLVALRAPQSPVGRVLGVVAEHHI